MKYTNIVSSALLSGLICIALAGCNSSSSNSDAVGSGGTTTGGSTPVQPAQKKVFVVILENTDAAQALQQPFLAKLAAGGATLTNSLDIGHPSQPNYFALTSGSTWGVTDDGTHNENVRHIGNLVEEKGLTWKSYAEDYPGGCNLSATIGEYARKHEPFLSYTNVQTDATRCARVVNSSQLATDIAANNLPNFSLYVPNLLNDGHDTGVAYADNWLSTTFSSLIQDPNFMKNNLLVVTFDEGSTGDQIYTVLYGDSVIPGSTSNQVSGHYGLLATIEQVLGLGNLGQNDATAQPITGIWK